MARPPVGSCIVLIICVMLSDVNLHYLTLAARCPVSRCWPSCFNWPSSLQLLKVWLSPQKRTSANNQSMFSNFYRLKVLHITQPTSSCHWRELTSTMKHHPLTSFVLDSPTNSREKECCILHACSPAPVPRQTKPPIEQVQALADISRSALCCHSNETRAPTANPQ